MPLRHLYLQWTLSQRFTDQAMAKATVWATHPLHTHDPVPAAASALGAFAAWRAGAGRAAGCTDTLLPPAPLPSHSIHVQDVLVPCTLTPGTTAPPVPLLLPGEEAVQWALPCPLAHGEGGNSSLPSPALLQACFPHGLVTASSAASLVPAIHKLGEACRMASTALSAARRASDSPRAHHARWVASASKPSNKHTRTWPQQPHIAHDWRRGWAHLEHAVPVARALALGQWLQGQFSEAITEGLAFLQEMASADAVPWVSVRGAAAACMAGELGTMLRLLLRCALVQPLQWAAQDTALSRLTAHLARGVGGAGGGASRRSSRGAGAMLSQSSWTMSQSQSQGGGRPRHSSKRFRSYLGNQDDSDDSSDSDTRAPQASVSDSESVSAASAGTGSTRSGSAGSRRSTGSSASIHSHKSADTASSAAGGTAPAVAATPPSPPLVSSGVKPGQAAAAASSVGASSSSVHSAVSLRRGVAALSEWCACAPPPQAYLPPPSDEDSDVVHGAMLSALAVCVRPRPSSHAAPKAPAALRLEQSEGAGLAAGIAVRCRSSVATALQRCQQLLSPAPVVTRQAPSRVCGRASPRCVLWHCAAALARQLLQLQPHGTPSGGWPLIAPCEHEACTGGGSRPTPISALEDVLQLQFSLGCDGEALLTLAGIARGGCGHCCPSLLLEATGSLHSAAHRQQILWVCARHWLAVFRAVGVCASPHVRAGGTAAQAAALQGARDVLTAHLALFPWGGVRVSVPCSNTQRVIDACKAAAAGLGAKAGLSQQ